MSQNTAAQNITEGVIWKQLLSFFFPIVLGTFFQQMYNTVDTIIVGRFVGTEALAAVGSTGALISLLNGPFRRKKSPAYRNRSVSGAGNSDQLLWTLLRSPDSAADENPC